MPFFQDFSLQPTTCATLASMGITEPTPIQAEAIPVLLAGKDLVGQSATGSGKTLAYGIPLIERVSREKRVAQALILVPTRELAVQVNSVLGKLAVSRRLTTALLVGGRAYSSQMSALRYGAQIIVGTPGRIKDHLDRRTLSLSQVRICVLDESDQMLDSGFAPAIEEILTTTPETRQMALFSATMPDWVEKLQQKFLKEPVHVSITPATGAQSTIEQIAYQVPAAKKMAALCTLLHTTQGESTLIFGRTKFGVERLGKQLSKMGFTVGTLHGDKSQRAREDVLTAFRRGQVQTLLATNVAARGLDIRGIYQVINYELPESSELFTHRIGRTGRMGQTGKAITLLSPSDMSKWRRMSQSLGQAVALQRLAIDEAAFEARMLTAPDDSAVQERQPASAQRAERGSRKSADVPAERISQPTRERQEVTLRDENEQAERDRKRFTKDQEREARPLRTRKEFAPRQENAWQEESRTERPHQQSIEEWEREQGTERPRRQFVEEREPGTQQRRQRLHEEQEQRFERPRHRFDERRERRDFGPQRERGGLARPAYEGQARPGLRRGYSGENASKAERKSPWWPEGFHTSERSFRDDRGETGERDRRATARPQGRAEARSRAYAFEVAAPQSRPSKKKKAQASNKAKTAKIKRKLDAKRAAKQ